VRIPEMIHTRLFDRIPGLEVVFAEVDAGWVPYVMEQLDDRYARQNPKNKRHLDHMPSEYFSRNLHFTIVNDRYGVRNRHEIGLDRILWSSDFPHAGCDFPNYADVIEVAFAGVPERERQQILAENARHLYLARR